MFNREVGEVSGFPTICRLYIRMRMRDMEVEEQVQWVLSYVQRGSVDIWKENIMEDLESGNLSYATVEEFLSDLKQEFSGGDGEMMKVAELKKIEQGSRTMKEFVQEFRRAVRGSGYKRRPLVEEFK